MNVPSPRPAISLFLLLLSVAIIYYPALSGNFLLDDLQSLKDLAEIEARGFAYYIFSSNTGPGGRPLSLLTFALQHPSWPANPFAFKLVNLLMHLGNGVLIFYLCRLLSPALSLTGASHTVFALLVTALWLLHPLQLSTVFYIVQRMTMLATMFMLLGIILYLHGRQIYLQSRSRYGLLMALSGTYVCTMLAILSKEIGILLPLYLLVLELTLLADGQAIRIWRRYSVAALLLPLLIFGAYLINGFDGLLAAYQIRDYSMGQRLLTEMNVLIDYLRLILLPVAGSFSIFHDDYPIASGLFSPPITVVNAILILSLISAALVWRKKAVVFSFAILWFFAGHTLESSFIGLEIYFEHRNYLPIFGIIILMIWAALRISGQIKSRPLRLSVIPALMLVMITVTLLEANLWGQPYLQAHEWVRQHPQSKRAVNNLLNISLVAGEKEVASEALANLVSLDRQDIYPVVKEITIRSCYDQEQLTTADWIHYNQLAVKAQFRGLGAVSELGHLLYQYNRGNCGLLDVNNLEALVVTLADNTAFSSVKGRLYEMATTLAVLQGDLDKALSHINSSISMLPLIDSMIYKLRILIAREEWPAAVRLLEQIKNQLQRMPRQNLVYGDIIRELEQQIALSAHAR